jgi:predicted nucleic acid-binding protein
LDTDLRKSLIAKEIISKKPLINSQVLVEVINVCKRKFGYSKPECLNLWKDLQYACNIAPIDESTINYAKV